MVQNILHSPKWWYFCSLIFSRLSMINSVFFCWWVLVHRKKEDKRNMPLYVRLLSNCGARLSTWVLSSLRMKGELEGDKVYQQVHRSEEHWGRVPRMSILRKGEGLPVRGRYDLPDVVLDPEVSGRNDQETETDISQELNHITWPQKQRHILSLL